jgi:hypothetical protein
MPEIPLIIVSAAGDVAVALEDALSPVAAGATVRMGFTGYDRRNPATVGHLLQQARIVGHPIFA